MLERYVHKQASTLLSNVNEVRKGLKDLKFGLYVQYRYTTTADVHFDLAPPRPPLNVWQPSILLI